MPERSPGSRWTRRAEHPLTGMDPEVVPSCAVALIVKNGDGHGWSWVAGIRGTA
jgi:hypothetical protein